MNLLEKMRMIERVDGLIRKKNTGTPARLALRLGISERNTYHLVNTMKNMGAPIYFCKTRNSYCYEEKGRFLFGFKTDEGAFYGGKRPEFELFLTLQSYFSGRPHFYMVETGVPQPAN